MNTETADIAGLRNGDKVTLLGDVYEVGDVGKNIAGGWNMDLDKVKGFGSISFYDLPEDTPFERVIPDPEDSRVRSTAMPQDYWADFESSRLNDDEVVITAYKMGALCVSFVVDKADLKAVVEKL